MTIQVGSTVKKKSGKPFHNKAKTAKVMAMTTDFIPTAPCNGVRSIKQVDVVYLEGCVGFVVLGVLEEVV